MTRDTSLVDDQLWQLLEPLLPRPARRYRCLGRKRLDDRKVLSGIVFVLTTPLLSRLSATSDGRWAALTVG